MIKVRHGLLLVALSALSLAAAPVAGAHVQDPAAPVAHAQAAAVASTRGATYTRSDSKAPPQLLGHPRVKPAQTSGNLGWVALAGLLLMAGIAGVAVVFAERGIAGVNVKRGPQHRPLAH